MASRFTSCAFAALLVLATAPPSARACAPAPPPGVTIEIADEEAIIVWDAARGVEHFIRRAAFRAHGATGMPHFGFLVPSPSKPELAEAPDGLFAQLAEHTRPRVIFKTRHTVDVNLSCLLLTAKSRDKAATAGRVAAVRVEHRQRVAGYDAVVLSADNADALAKWLKERGYAQRPSLAQWLQPYVAAKWKITAFKIAAGNKSDDISTSAVRMTFAAKRPFYPYREPADMRADPEHAKPRGLRVFFVADKRYGGALAGVKGGWPATVKLAAPIAMLRGQLSALKGAALPAGSAPLWLTVFSDKSSPRPGVDDVFFAPSVAQKPMRPAPVIHWVENAIPIPVDVILATLLLIAAIIWRRRRRRARAEAKPSASGSDSGADD